MLLQLTKKLKNAVHDRDNIYLSDQIDTAFVLGAFRPKIYLPSYLGDTQRDYILLHEQTHIRRLDHMVKLAGFFVLLLHWFNPLVWIAFYASGKDMEMSCDEAVVKKLGNGVKKDYSTSLLSLATGRKIVGGTPLAFGEGDTRGRIKNVLNYKKPGSAGSGSSRAGFLQRADDHRYQSRGVGVTWSRRDSDPEEKEKSLRA